MAWEWSHAPQSYANAYANLLSLHDAELLEIRAEWFAHNLANPKGSEPTIDDFEIGERKALEELETYGAENVTEWIWADIEELRTCDNGGHNAWACPFGCHTVPFSAPTESADCEAL